MSARSLRILAAGLTVAIATACGGDSPTGPDGPTGSYSLQTVNGKGLPYTLLDTVEQGIAVRVEIISPSTLTLGPSSAFRLILTFRGSGGGLVQVQPDTLSGTYTRNGSSLTLSAPGEGTVLASWDQGDQITVLGGGDALVFRR